MKDLDKFEMCLQADEYESAQVPSTQPPERAHFGYGSFGYSSIHSVGPCDATRSVEMCLQADEYEAAQVPLLIF